MIPLHDLGGEDPAAVGARPAIFQAEEPRGPASLPRASRHARAAKALVAIAVDLRPARFAVGLHSITSASVDVKLGKWLRLATARATFHCT